LPLNRVIVANGNDYKEENQAADQKRNGEISDDRIGRERFLVPVEQLISLASYADAKMEPKTSLRKIVETVF